jgi:D-glycero-D-manno-heptose 1,7-bisphosphate phosphatase
MATPALAPAVFLDRDGTLIRNVDYINDPQDVEILPGVPEGLGRLNAAGFRCVIVTNQSGIARGRGTIEQYEAVEGRTLELIGPGLIAATYMCPDFGPRRKPSPAMILEAARDLHLDLGRSFMIGDKASDVICGQRAGAKGIFIETGYELDEPCEADFTAATFAAAVDWILESHSRALHGD